jgi:hypothetical protein
MAQQYAQAVQEQYEPEMSELSARRFATRLRKLYRLLSESIQGVEDTGARACYASLLIYRLMFIYFWLYAGERRYLQQRLEEGQEPGGTGFYRMVLRPCFAGEGRWKELPFSPTVLFTSHTIEQSFPALAIPDEIFVRLFALFEEQRRQINERPGEREFALEIYGDLMAQTLQPEEMGSYYTPGEITMYIARNTLFPALLTRVRERCKDDRLPDGLLWQQLTRRPERYLFTAARRGCEHALPPEIAAGLHDLTQRQRWQENAPEQYALPGETWRAVIARRAQTAEILARLQRGEREGLDRLTTWNVNQPLLALEALQNCRQPELLLNFYESLRQLTVLDPTCGSGAFLLATLSQLKPLYSACLALMEQFLAAARSTELSPPLRQTFEHYLEEAGEPQHREQTILRWISGYNLYGVDLMEEAVEICRLRLVLRMLAAGPGLRLADPAREVGQHIRVGNSLAGPFNNKREAKGGQETTIEARDAFDWTLAFPEVIARRGFDVVLGNPPYVEYQQVRQLYRLDGYATLETGNLFALTIERSAHLLAPGGRCGMIVPSSATCTDGYRSLQQLLLAQQELHIASFSDQRGRLFDLPHPRLCVLLFAKPDPRYTRTSRVFSTPYLKLGHGSRRCLFEHLRYTEVTGLAQAGFIPRYGSPLERTICEKLARQAHTLGAYLSPAGAYPIYYTRKLSWFVQVTPFIPLILDSQGQARAPSELKTLRFASPVHAQIALAALNSTLFYWLVTTRSDCRNLNKREVAGFPLDLACICPLLQQELCQLSEQLGRDLREQARMRGMRYRDGTNLTIQCIYPARSKGLIDEIDRVLAQHYRLNEEELDFLLHYDEIYRVPRRRV